MHLEALVPPGSMQAREPWQLGQAPLSERQGGAGHQAGLLTP